MDFIKRKKTSANNLWETITTIKPLFTNFVRNEFVCMKIKMSESINLLSAGTFCLTVNSLLGIFSFKEHASESAKGITKNQIYNLLIKSNECERYTEKVFLFELPSSMNEFSLVK